MRFIALVGALAEPRLWRLLQQTKSQTGAKQLGFQPGERGSDLGCCVMCGVSQLDACLVCQCRQLGQRLRRVGDRHPTLLRYSPG